MDTLIVKTKDGYKIERYVNQNLDEYNYITELNHEQLFNCKEMGAYFMDGISLNDIVDYLKKEFNFYVNN